jgi:hypothetical protein
VPEFAALCKAVKSLPGSRGLDLESFLIKPVQVRAWYTDVAISLGCDRQRVCKYPLLIDQLVKATPAEHPDLPLVGVAVCAHGDIDVPCARS